MYVVSPVANPPNASVAPEPLAHGIPCAFRGCSAFYHPGGSATGVVLCSPWGFEDLTMRKSWRRLAEAIAAAGYPCLRFDYPGTGDSLGGATEINDIGDWVTAIRDAAGFLRLASGARRFVFVGLSLGAALAVEAARGRSDVVGLQLIAPIVKGRAYVRELAATATMVAERIGIRLELALDEGVSVLGFSLAPSMVESLTRLDMTKGDAPSVPFATVFDQPDRKAGAEAVEHLRRLGCAAVLEPIAPFHVMVSDATVIQPLPVAAERIVARLQAIQPAIPMPKVSVPALATALAHPLFREEPIRFGRDGSLFGVLCRPAITRRGAPSMILLNRGLNPHVGWRRVSVDHARGLAAIGIASLRFDMAGLGESCDEPGRPANLIYSDLLLPDIAAAVDALVARGHPRIALVGVCSGAYMALAAAHADPRIAEVIAVNPQRLVWNPAETHDDVIRYGLRSMHDYVGDLRSGRAIRKLIASRRRIVPAARFLLTRTVRHALARVPLSWRSMLMRNSMAARVRSFFETLALNGTRVSLVFSEGDPGLMELRNYFGPAGRDLVYPNVTVTLVPDADHNFTSTRASASLLDHVAAVALESAAQGLVAAVPRPSVKADAAACPG